MEPIIITAASLEEAKKDAATKFGVDESEVSVKVLEEVKGLFGKVQLRVEASVGGKASKPAAKKAPAAKKPAKPEKAVVEAPVEAAPVEEAAPAKKSARPARGKKADAPSADAGEQAEGGESETVSYNATDADAKVLADIAVSILEAADIDAQIEVVSLNGRYVNLKVDGKDTAHLVGKHGEVLNAFQMIVNVIGSKKMEGAARATIDGNSYRERREKALTALAQDLAAEVINRKEEAVLDALPAFERRIVHKALQVIDGVSTYSEGEEPNRRVVIAPVG